MYAASEARANACVARLFERMYAASTARERAADAVEEVTYEWAADEQPRYYQAQHGPTQ